MYGFDENDYLEALNKVPVVSAEQFKNALSFLSELAVTIAETGLKNLELKERTWELEEEITDRKETEEALRESEQKYRELADSLPQTVFETDETGRLTFANRYAFELFGYTQNDFDKGLDATHMLIPADRDRSMENILKVLDGEEISGIEFTAMRKDGGTFPIVAHVNPIIREDRSMGLRE